MPLPINFVRWSEASRTLSAAEVDGVFSARREQVLLFAFTTDQMIVEEHSGAFSVKAVVRGAEHYRIGKRSIALTPGRILIVNAGEQYSSSVDHRMSTSLSFFLPPLLACEAVRSLTDSDEQLLDAPTLPGPIPDVPQVPFRAGAELATAFGNLVAAAYCVGAPSLDRLQQLVFSAATLAVRDSPRLMPARALRGCVRRSTREELTTRALRARDFIDDCGGHASLTQMANVACLSKFHFLRVFTDAVGCTPACYARDVRLRRATGMLRRGRSARDAARVAGFSSSSSLLRAMRRRRG